jgi:hypothetical protein
MERTERNRAARRAPVLGLLATLAALGACAGENLFSLATSSGAVGPDVELTSPSDAFTLTIGDSIRVRANVNAPQGGGSVVYRASYAGTETAAFTSETQNLNGLVVATLDNYLKAAAAQTAGSAYIVVEVTDLAGAMGKDSVKVTIAN